MAAPSDALTYQIATIRKLIANVSPDQMAAPTPCSKWTVHDLINHMVGGGMLFGAGLAGQPVEMDPDGDLPDFLGDDALAAWALACTTFCAGADSPGALDRVITLPYGDLPGSVVLEIGKVDLLIHAWDLACATDQTIDPPDDVVESAIASAHGIIAPELRNGDVFASEVTAPPNARPIDRLAAFSGRAI